MSAAHICSNCDAPTNLQAWSHGVWFWFCADCYAALVPAAEREDDREPDYNYTPYEESRSYRESMIDAGRRHLLK
jgi:hypothetical protein